MEKSNKIFEYEKEYHLWRHNRLITSPTFYEYMARISHAKFFKSFLDNKNKVLEIGCGMGQNIYFNKDKSLGIDVSDFAISLCKKREIEVLKISAEEIDSHFSKSSFQGIICSHVLEHLKNPFEILCKINIILEKEGFLVIAIPLPMTLSKKEDGHLYCWNKTEITNLLSITGFEVIEIEIFSVRLKSILYKLPFKMAFNLGKVAGMILHNLGIKLGVDELIVKSKKIKEIEF